MGKWVMNVGGRRECDARRRRRRRRAPCRKRSKSVRSWVVRRMPAHRGEGVPCNLYLPSLYVWRGSSSDDGRAMLATSCTEWVSS